MFPIRDTVPGRNPPIATWLLILANGLVFLVELSMSPRALERFIYLFGIVPARYTHPEWAAWVGLPVDDFGPFLNQAEKAIAQVRPAVTELLADKHPPEKAESLARLLSEGIWTHDYPITFETATALGLSVRSDIPAEFVELMGLYPQPVRRQPTVEYLPQRRRLDGGEGSPRS